MNLPLFQERGRGIRPYWLNLNRPLYVGQSHAPGATQ